MALFPDFGFDLKNHSATIYDSGNEPFQAMSIEKIGKPIAAFLKHPKRQRITTSGFLLLQPHSERSSRLTNKKWDTTTISTDEARREGKIKLRNGDYKGAYVGSLVAQLYQDGAGTSVLDGAVNELLKVEPEELDEVARKALAWV
ncbi:hypothetical protein CFIO01_02803 [Colletotrichum fioriniae PJ7]|uniref:Uncharacterized protein n=1 Tax=Colletotrichum fioriniae PJ7 TaxID=1445577 RepID=A0A010QZX6_9PEZI|nr:hypothetical protein CFIO01_02803 [Colletotrichum fioriniae PJ7]